MSYQLGGLPEGMLDIAPPPCDRGCPLRAYCAREQAACRDFQNYANQGTGVKVWPASRIPTVAIFDELYPGVAA